MRVPLQITYRDTKPSAALDARIRDKAEALERFHPSIMSCRVTVEERDRHHHQGRQWSVKLDVRVPQRELAVTREHHEDVFVALRDAFDAAARQLEDALRVTRGDVKSHELPQRGRIARMFAGEGCGFIETADGRELYFSRENVVEPRFEHLAVGDVVQFIEAPAAEGRQAKRVSAGKHGGEA